MRQDSKSHRQGGFTTILDELRKNLFKNAGGKIVRQLSSKLDSGYNGIQKPSWRSSQSLQIEAWHSYSYTYLIPDHEAHQLSHCPRALLVLRERFKAAELVARRNTTLVEPVGVCLVLDAEPWGSCQNSCWVYNTQKLLEILVCIQHVQYCLILSVEVDYLFPEWCFIFLNSMNRRTELTQIQCRG